MKQRIYRLYAWVVLIIAYPFMHIEYQLRELCRAYRNWKPKSVIYHAHSIWAVWYKNNVKD